MDPVNEIFRMIGLAHNVSPARTVFSREQVTTFTRPAGTEPMSPRISQNARAERGVSSDGLITDEHPGMKGEK